MIKTTNERAEVEMQIRNRFDKLRIGLGVVADGSRSAIKITQSSKWPILYWVPSCGCMSEMEVINKGSGIKGHIEIDGKNTNTTETAYTDGKAYYKKANYADGLKYTDINTGKKHDPSDIKESKLVPVKLRVMKHSISMYFDKNTPMYIVKENRKLEKNSNKPSVTIPIEAYILPAE